MEMNQETKACQFCGENILAVAVKCKHCGSDLSAKAVLPRKPDETVGNLVFALPIVSAFAILTLPGAVWLITWATIIITAIMIATEAKKVGAGADTDLNEKGNRREGPTAWLIAGIGLWIVAYPVWLYRRSIYGLKNLLWPGLLSTLVFIAMVISVSYYVEKTKQEALRDAAKAERELLEQMQMDMGGGYWRH
jgi:hypothetical protein